MSRTALECLSSVRFFFLTASSWRKPVDAELPASPGPEGRYTHCRDRQTPLLDASWHFALALKGHHISAQGRA